MNFHQIKEEEPQFKFLNETLTTYIKKEGKAAMLGMFSLIGAYYFTGQILPGIF